MSTQRGHLVLADISGYTAFVADTELEHSREILNELLETLVRGMAEHLRIGQIEGDALVALGERLPADPLAWLHEIFFRFHRHLNRIKEVTTCPCKACANVGVLTLKFVCHYGEYLPQTFMGKETFVGNAVNMVHRLLKNKVPSREYLLATNDALALFPAGVRERFATHREEYDLGAVECGWMDLAALRADPRARDAVRTVDDAGAQLRTDTLVDAPKDAVWAVLTDPAQRQKWMGVQRIDYKPGARHTLAGAEYHCVHGANDVSVFRVGEALEPDRVTISFSPMTGVLVWWTVQLREGEGGRTRMISLLRIEPPGGPLGAIRGLMVKQIMKGYSTKYAGTIARQSEDLARARPSRGPVVAG